MSIQVENGNFARIHNEILERLALTDLSGSEFRCLLFLLRKTYGYQKKQDKISYSQFADGTGLERRSVIRSLEKLVSRNIIMCRDNGNNRPQSWAFNKYFEQWDKTSDNLVTKTSDQNDTSSYKTSDQNDTTSSDQNDTKTSDQNDTHNRYKDKKDSGIAPPPSVTPKANEYLSGLPDPRRRPSQAGRLAAQTADVAKLGVNAEQFRLIVDEILRGMGKLDLADHDDRTLAEAQDVARCLVALDARYKTPDGVKVVFDTWYGNNEFKGKAPYASQVKSYASQILAGKVKTKQETTPVVNWSNYGGGVPDYMRDNL